MAEPRLKRGMIGICDWRELIGKQYDCRFVSVKIFRYCNETAAVF